MGIINYCGVLLISDNYVLCLLTHHAPERRVAKVNNEPFCSKELLFTCSLSILKIQNQILVNNGRRAKWLSPIDFWLHAEAKMWNVHECLMSGSWSRRKRRLNFAEGRLVDLLRSCLKPKLAGSSGAKLFIIRRNYPIIKVDASEKVLQVGKEQVFATIAPELLNDIWYRGMNRKTTFCALVSTNSATAVAFSFEIILQCTCYTTFQRKQSQTTKTGTATYGSEVRFECCSWGELFFLKISEEGKVARVPRFQFKY